VTPRIAFAALSLVLLLAGAPGATGKDTAYYLPDNVTYNPDVPTPASYLGFRVGEWHLRHDELVSYLKHLANTSDRLVLEEYARSYELRPLLLLTVTSPQNHRNLGAIKKQHGAVCDPARSGSLDLEDMPVVVWMGYSIHGNEPSGANAAPLVAYYLAAAEGPGIDALLDRSVVLLDPCLNPDGFSRFAAWANTHRGKRPNADPNHREHREVWPGGRSNHYWFDLNRDWLPAQHPESQGRIARFHEWKPNVLTDHHEMGTNRTFFFQPGIPSRNNPLTPERTFELTSAIAAYHARALEGIGSLYYSEESFDDFYFGKGSTYPDINGCIGILFEQASTRGHLQDSIHGLLDFPFTIRNQVTVSISTLRAALELRADLLAHQRDFYTSALQEARRSSVKAYVFGSPIDPVRNYEFLSTLRRHRIQVRELAEPVEAGGRSFSPGSSYIASVAQPQYRLLTALFEKRTSFQDSLFYDVSAWTLPLAFGLPYAPLRARDLSDELLGRPVDDPAFPAGNYSGAADPYACVFEWKGYFAPRALYRFLDAGVKAKVATRPFEAATEAGRQRFGYGTILVPLGVQKHAAGKIDSLAEVVAREDGIDVYCLGTGLTPKGIDLGSPSFSPLEKPRVLLAVGSGVSSAVSGEVWHLLDRRYDMDVSLVDTERMVRVNLSRYNTIVLPAGSYGTLSEAGLDALTRWVRQGGTVIALGSAARWAVQKKLAKATFDTSRAEPPPERRAYASASRDRGAQRVGGAIFEADLDVTHPVGYGYESPALSVFRRGTLSLEPARSPYSTPLQYTDEPLQSGYISERNLERLAGSASVLVTSLGSGRVILMVDDPNFRAFWYGTNKLFANSVFFARTIGLSTTRTEETGD